MLFNGLDNVFGVGLVLLRQYRQDAYQRLAVERQVGQAGGVLFLDLAASCHHTGMLKRLHTKTSMQMLKKNTNWNLQCRWNDMYISKILKNNKKRSGQF